MCTHHGYMTYMCTIHVMFTWNSKKVFFLIISGQHLLQVLLGIQLDSEVRDLGRFHINPKFGFVILEFIPSGEVPRFQFQTCNLIGWKLAWYHWGSMKIFCRNGTVISLKVVCLFRKNFGISPRADSTGWTGNLGWILMARLLAI